MISGYGQYCPIAKGSEVFAERWTPLIVRNLYLGCRSFNEILEGVPRMSRSLLTQRLRTLERAGVVVTEPIPGRRGHHYYLTPAGQELADVCLALGTWGARWLELAPEDFDPAIVLWAWRKDLRVSRLPRRRVVVRFDLTDRPKERYWLVMDHRDTELCIKDPGFEPDLVVTTTARAVTEVHMGRSIDEARRAGDWRMEGPADLVRAFPTWGGVSRFARVRSVRAAAG
jgi:DNA-binding HxlR family transcriptional regulator